MNSNLYTSTYNPDVLTCLANLSNDEVFTPPEIVNSMLDMLPKELWRDKNAKFLDPACKSGVFLREIAKRLLEGLKEEIPDLQMRIDNIFKNQLYGIAITELTSLLSRRSVYCSKYPNSQYSVTSFDDADGNIRFKRISHIWVKGKCAYCGASESEYGDKIRNNLETHAYEFLHVTKPEEIFKMKFDVIIGNPPYQLSDGGHNASATPIYNLFVEQAKKLNPGYVIMVIPSRWYCGGRGLENFRMKMFTDGHLKEIHDYKKASDCFPGIRNGGGICYFLWDKRYNSSSARVVSHTRDSVISDEIRPITEFSSDIFIRDTVVCSVLRKVALLNEPKFSDRVLRQKPYGFRTNFTDFDKNGNVKIYTKKVTAGYAYIKRQNITVNIETIDKWKVVTSRSTSVPEEDNGQVLRMSQTFIVEPNAVVSESYVVLGVFDAEINALNCYSYIKTRFFRFLCQPTIVSPDISKRSFVLIPDQKYNQPWNDKELYKKYKLNDEEIEYIESLIRPMDLNGGDKDE